MPFTVAADEVLDGCWAVVDHNGTVARRVLRAGQHAVPRPAVFESRAEAAACARRWNTHLDATASSTR